MAQQRANALPCPRKQSGDILFGSSVIDVELHG